MTTTDRLQHILAQIRSGLTARTRDSGKVGGITAKASHGARPVAEQRLTIEMLQSQISAGLAVVNLGTAQGKKDARRVFLESVLLGEFGIGLAGDPRFAELVTSVQDSFEEEESLLSDLDHVLEDLARH